MTKEEIVDNIARFNSQTWRDREEVRTEIGKLLAELKKALEQQPSDCKIFGTKENCFGGATENECEHCDYKIQKLEQHCEDCISRQAVLDTLMKYEQPCDDRQDFYLDSTTEFEAEIKNLPPVTPTHGTCKDCKHWKDSDGVYRRGIGAESKCPLNILQVFDGDFYCADFEKRGNENEIYSGIR